MEVRTSPKYKFSIWGFRHTRAFGACRPGSSQTETSEELRPKVTTTGAGRTESHTRIPGPFPERCPGPAARAPRQPRRDRSHRDRSPRRAGPARPLTPTSPAQVRRGSLPDGRGHVPGRGRAGKRKRGNAGQQCARSGPLGRVWTLTFPEVYSPAARVTPGLTVTTRLRLTSLARGGGNPPRAAEGGGTSCAVSYQACAIVRVCARFQDGGGSGGDWRSRPGGLEASAAALPTW